MDLRRVRTEHAGAPKHLELAQLAHRSRAYVHRDASTNFPRRAPFRHSMPKRCDLRARG